MHVLPVEDIFYWIMKYGFSMYASCLHYDFSTAIPATYYPHRTLLRHGSMLHME